MSPFGVISTYTPAHLAQAFPHRDHLQRRTDRLGIVLRDAADQRVGVAHAGPSSTPNRFGFSDQLFGLAARHALPLPQLIQLFGVLAQSLRFCGIDDLRSPLRCRCSSAALRADPRFVSEQDRDRRSSRPPGSGPRAGSCGFSPSGNTIRLGCRCALWIMTRITSCALPSRRSSCSRYSSRSMRLLRHAGLHRRLRHRRRLPDQHARIERLGDDVLAAELQRLDAVRAPHGIGHVLAAPAPPARASPPASSRR